MSYLVRYFAYFSIVSVLVFSVPLSVFAQHKKADSRSYINQNKPIRVSDKEIISIEGTVTAISGPMAQIEVLHIYHQGDKTNGLRKEENIISVNSAVLSVDTVISARLKKDLIKKISIGEKNDFNVKVSTGGFISIDSIAE